MQRNNVCKRVIIFIVSVACFSAMMTPAFAASPVRLQLNGETVRLDVPPFISDEHRTMVPIRFISEQLGLNVDWNASSRKVTVSGALSSKGDKKNVFIEMIAGEKSAKVNDRTILLDSPVTVLHGTTFVPLRFVLESLHTDLLWDGASKTVKLTTDIWTSKQTVTVNGRKFNVNVVYIPNDKDVSIALAKGEIGQTASLQTIAEQSKAQAAMNGAFFEAYAKPAEPWGTLIHNSEVIHVGSTGTAIGFTSNGEVLMDELRLRIFGEIDGKRAWYAYNFNRTPSPGSSAVYIYNQYRGHTTKVKDGISVIVKDGKVSSKVVNREVTIPSNGYVIHFTGKEMSLAERFEVGQTVSYHMTYENRQGEELPWQDVQTAVGAGPRLVKDGRVSLSPEAEGFRDQKILTSSSARSAIGVMPQGTIVLASVDAATMRQWAIIMRKLGTTQAMNLDGGASSGLYVHGKMITEPGRELSNVLIFK